MNVVLRAKSIIADPPSEWDEIARQSDNATDILTRYVAPLAIIPNLFGFIGVCLIGAIAHNGGIVRMPLIDGVFSAVFGYVMACTIVLAVALIIYVLAPLLGGRRGFDGAFALAAYSFTPAWLCGIFLLLPGLHFLALFGLYGLYLVWRGAPRLAKMPEEKALIFAISIVACAAVLIYAAAMAQRVIFGSPVI